MISSIKYKLGSLRRLRKFDNFFQLLVSHALYPSGYIGYVWKGRTILVDGRRAETAGGIHAVLIAGEYDVFLEKLDAASVTTILDLGANVGSFTILAADTFENIEKIVLIEGDSTVIPRLHFNVHSALPGKVSIIHGAVCGTDGEVMFFQNPTSVGSGIKNHDGGNVPTEIVPAYSLSTLIDREFPSGTIDICKMDIEGSEYDAIHSLRDDQLERIRLLLIELHGSEEDDQRIFHRLKKQGFDRSESNSQGNHQTFAFFNSRYPLAGKNVGSPQ